MPVFHETAHASRELRIKRSRARPLPRLSAQPDSSRNIGQDDSERFEVVVIGAGPAGLFLTLLLARYGLSDSLACFDKKPGTLKAGQADGLQPRTLEVFSTLGLHHEILDDGCHMSEVAFWNPSTRGGIERTAFVPDVVVPARYKHEVTIHQGRIERILEEDFQAYSPSRSIFRATEFVDFSLDPVTDSEYPVRVKIDVMGDDESVQRKVVRAKHLVGADGAHSRVRRSMGLQLHGDTTDHIWGVVDFVADTNFPDIRKRCAIHSDTGSVMVIPRERIASGHYLTRLYVQIKDGIAPAAEEGATLDEKAKARQRRAAITLESILEQGKRVFAPYKIAIKPGTVVDWWAAYQIGQRMTPSSTLKDENGVERVFLVGDACHTHSPKAGQGMNVSMMDSYNLAWKLAHSIHGLSPKSAPHASLSNARYQQNTPRTVLNTFESERLGVARQLIEFDSKFSSMFSGQIGAEDSVEGLTHEEFLKVFSDGSGFTSGCGVEYEPSIIVDRDISTQNGGVINSTKSSVAGDDYLSGILRPGRRLLDTVVRRYADANLRHIHDEIPSTGRYCIFVFATHDLVDRQNDNRPSISAQALEAICHDIIPAYPTDTIELVTLHPFRTRDFEWDQMPSCLKDFAEMSFHGPVGTEPLYEIYGVSEDGGAVVVIRPDGYVGAVKCLSDVRSLESYFDNCLVRVDALGGGK
ncbi:phenol monooxygenase, putative [Talaromyces stipitatus ATCC 10500]|uniref:Phenol monooxygenase, putative n=1 Tax=Talaromyces stipitatus (strain ATCC 10500 / CBS 375.48 / QM 6759 / NRRL 1006) TaxID=441959 RepID=B8M1T4_TALSN|nr:phenol monooxygenase, putative [Talaromyces stipitatus ATCC 10500]EED21312.1 phenol monooxygenase, putative [Talaromyces stipitatus ATCC 10500]